MGLAARWLLAALLAAALSLLARRLLARLADAPVETPVGRAARRFRANGGAVVALHLLVALVVVTLLAPALAPYPPAAQPDIVALKSLPPSLAHPFGTDQYSRDVLSRVLFGGRVSLAVAVLSVLVAISLGVAYGGVAGLAGGRTDGALMRLNDALLAVPRVLLLIAVLAALGQIRLPLLVVLIGLTGWFGVSRIVRAEVRSVGGTEFVTAARALGAPRRRILLRHVLPNALSPVIVAATLAVGNVIILEAGLSYLGIGVQPPQASWGNILQEGASHLRALWWLSLFPGLAIVLTVMAVNLVGDGLRDALDPRQVDGR
jgi:peptide/nickel transport system permease protein